jgi:arylsulfatase A-like enzyme
MSSTRRRLLAALAVVAVCSVAAISVIRARQPQPIRFRGERSAPAAAPVITAADTSLTDVASAARLRELVRHANVVICVLDAARADHFGAYGYPRETTPNFDRLARESVLFDQHFSQYPQTSPSTATLFTGQYPDTHGVAVPRTNNPKDRLWPLQPEAFTIDRAMGEAGFRTLLFTSTPAAAPVLNLGANFDVLITPMGMVRSEQDDAVWRAPENLLVYIRENLNAKARFFSYVHFLPPHNPYEASKEIQHLFSGEQAPTYFEAAPAFTHVYDRFHDHDPPATGSDWVNLYDAELRWGDWALGELVAYLKQIGVYDNTVLIVTADHGEALGEHRYQWHATCPYDEAIHIPLLIRFPHGAGPKGRVGALTETIDVLPTILDLVGAPPPAGTVQGASLVPLLTGEKQELRDYVFVRTNGRWPCYVVHDHRWALLLYRGGKMRALYDLATDPRQAHNVIAEQQSQAVTMTKVFVEFARTQPFLPLDFVDPHFRSLTAPAGAGETLSPEARRKLRSLGYTD